MVVPKYDVTAVGYWNRHEQLYDSFFGVEHKPDALIYSALELRCALERTPWEYLFLLTRRDFSKTLEKEKDPGRIKKKILSCEPEFIKKIKFMNILIRANGSSLSLIVVPDLDKFDRIHGQLSNYLHVLKRPPKTADWKQLLSLLKEGGELVRDVISGGRGVIELNEIGLARYEEFKSGKYSEDEMIARIKADRAVTEGSND